MSLFGAQLASPGMGQPMTTAATASACLLLRSRFLTFGVAASWAAGVAGAPTHAAAELPTLIDRAQIGTASESEWSFVPDGAPRNSGADSYDVAVTGWLLKQSTKRRPERFQGAPIRPPRPSRPADRRSAGQPRALHAQRPGRSQDPAAVEVGTTLWSIGGFAALFNPITAMVLAGEAFSGNEDGVLTMPDGTATPYALTGGGTFLLFRDGRPPARLDPDGSTDDHDVYVTRGAKSGGPLMVVAERYRPDGGSVWVVHDTERLVEQATAGPLPDGGYYTTTDPNRYRVRIADGKVRYWDNYEKKLVEHRETGFFYVLHGETYNANTHQRVAGPEVTLGKDSLKMSGGGPAAGEAGKGPQGESDEDDESPKTGDVTILVAEPLTLSPDGNKGPRKTVASVIRPNPFSGFPAAVGPFAFADTVGDTRFGKSRFGPVVATNEAGTLKVSSLVEQENHVGEWVPHLPLEFIEELVNGSMRPWLDRQQDIVLSIGERPPLPIEGATAASQKAISDWVAGYLPAAALLRQAGFRPVTAPSNFAIRFSRGPFRSEAALLTKRFAPDASYGPDRVRKDGALVERTIREILDKTPWGKAQLALGFRVVDGKLVTPSEEDYRIGLEALGEPAVRARRLAFTADGEMVDLDPNEPLPPDALPINPFLPDPQFHALFARGIMPVSAGDDVDTEKAPPEHDNSHRVQVRVDRLLTLAFMKGISDASPQTLADNQRRLFRFQELLVVPDENAKEWIESLFSASDLSLTNGRNAPAARRQIQDRLPTSRAPLHRLATKLATEGPAHFRAYGAIVRNTASQSAYAVPISLRRQLTEALQSGDDAHLRDRIAIAIWAYHVWSLVPESDLITVMLRTAGSDTPPSQFDLDVVESP